MHGMALTRVTPGCFETGGFEGLDTIHSNFIDPLKEILVGIKLSPGIWIT